MSEIIGNKIPILREWYEYYVTPAEGNAYNWTATGGEIISGDGSPQVTVIWIDILAENKLEVLLDDGEKNVIVVWPSGSID